MDTLQYFYKSKKWEKLVKYIKAERINAQGELLCEYCQKPIVKAYDCIGHHKEPLTEQNVEDVSVSLNPENIMLVHHKCHNHIHQKLCHEQRQVFVVWGSPFSGKSTFVKQNMAEGDIVVDMDSIWQCVSGCERYVKPNRLKSVVFTIHSQLLECVRMRQGKWLTAWVIGGYPFEGERQRLLNALGARDIFIDTPKEECIKRLFDSEQRNQKQWLEFIQQWWERYSPPQSALTQPMGDC